MFFDHFKVRTGKTVKIAGEIFFIIIFANILQKRMHFSLVLFFKRDPFEISTLVHHGTARL